MPQQLTTPPHTLDTTLAAHIDGLNDLAWQVRDSEPPRALALSQEAYQIASADPADAPPYWLGVAHSLTVQSFLHFRQAQFDQALTKAFTALNQLETLGDQRWLPRLYNIIGNTHDSLGNNADAVDYLLRQLKLSQTLGDAGMESIAYHDLGSSAMDQGNFARAVEYHLVAQRLSRAQHDLVGEIYSLNNLVTSYVKLAHYEKAQTCAELCYALAAKTNDPTTVILALEAMAVAQTAQGDHQAALQSYRQALELARQGSDWHGVVNNLQALGKVQLTLGQLEPALHNLQEAVTLAQQSKQQIWLVNSYALLAEAWKAQGDFKQAFTYYKQFHEAWQQLTQEENQNKARALEVIHRTEQARREAELLQAKNGELEAEIARRERTERAVVQAQKLESIGILAGGIAHDFNNLLMLMTLNGDLASKHLEAADPTRLHLEKSRQAMQKAADLVGQMLDFAGQRLITMQATTFNHLIEKHRPLFANILADKARLDLALTDPLPTIAADDGQMQQIFVNLVVNAIEAGATQITLRTYPLVITAEDDRFWRYTGHPLPPAEYAAFETTDNGQGMEATTLDRLFDPFYSTKFLGRGLGLAAVLGIVSGHRGGIAVESSPGQGATFTIVLPVN